MKAADTTPIDHIYLLRCWTVRPSATTVEWRFTLVHPYTHARRTFTTLAALVDFLEIQMVAAVTTTIELTPLSKQIDE